MQLIQTIIEASTIESSSKGGCGPEGAEDDTDRGGPDKVVAADAEAAPTADQRWHATLTTRAP